MIECDSYLPDEEIVNEEYEYEEEEEEAGDEEAGDEEAGDEEAGDEEAGDEEAGDEEEDIEEIVAPIKSSSKASSRRSESVLNKKDKAEKIDKMLKEKILDDAINENLEKKNFVKKSKPKPDYIAPTCVITKRSVNLKNKNVEKYYKNLKEGTLPKPKGELVKQEKENDECDVEALKEIIGIYLDLDEQVAKLSAELKEYRAEKKQYEEHILDFMEECNKEKVKHEKTTLLREVKEYRPKPKEEDMLQTLITVLKDESVASTLVKKIFEDVPLAEKVKLKQDKPLKAKKITKKVKDKT